MSIISLQYGQCGNQIGEALHATIFEDSISEKGSAYSKKSINKWFNTGKRGVLEARSILIDTENKVVQSRKETPYKFNHIVTNSYGGSANNWAFGYNSHSKLISGKVLNILRKEVEKCDVLDSFFNIFSSSGGTGSGVGCNIIETLRRDYPNRTIVNCVILPYMNGEVVTQCYNTVLSLSKIYSISTTTILYENDRLHSNCTNYVDSKDINFSDINKIVAHQIASVYQPLGRVNNSTLLSNLTSFPHYKFVQIKSAPHEINLNSKYEPPPSWKSLLGMISKQSRFDYQQEKLKSLKTKIIGQCLITRGADEPTENDVDSIKDFKTSVTWSTDNFNTYHQPRKFCKYEKSATSITNSNNICTSLNLLIEDAWKLFTHGAYVHHYAQYDVDEQYFLQSFQTLENILHAYKTL